MVLGHDVTHENTMTQSHLATPLCDAFSPWDCADQLSWYDPMGKTRHAMGKYMVLRHGDLMGNTIAEHHHPGGVYCHGVFPWVPNFYLNSHGVEIPSEKFMVFHGCRISTSKDMGSKYHGEKFMAFHGCRIFTSKAMGFFHGFPMQNFYKSCADFSGEKSTFTDRQRRFHVIHCRLHELSTPCATRRV
jgi:hypothetical protein